MLSSEETSLLESQYRNLMRKDYVTKEVAWRFGSEKPHPWLTFHPSDPKKHTQAHFQYLVHAIRPVCGRTAKESITYFYAKPAIGTSLVSELHRHTFYPLGLILNVPPENIVSARPYGTASTILKPTTTEIEFTTAINEANEIWGVLSPEEILMYSQLGQRENEMYTITGFKYSALSKVLVSGIFIHYDCGNDIYQLADELVSNLEVPLVRF